MAQAGGKPMIFLLLPPESCDGRQESIEPNEASIFTLCYMHILGNVWF